MPHQHVYEVDVIYQNDKFENMKQMLDTLENLQRITEEIFGRIEQKIGSHKQKLESVEKRTLDATQKVKNLSTRKQATTIISSNEYPKRKYESTLSALFTDDIHFTPHFHKKMKPTTKEELKVYNPIKQFEASVMRTKTKYEIVKETGTDKETSKLPYGLGRIPDNIGSVSNLLLFNTNEYVYKEYETIWNPLEGQDIRELPTEQQLNIDPPPNSLLKEDFMEFDVQKINFRPKIKDLPQFSLPQQLDLPDVIETSWDSNFSSISSIAPSGVLELLPSVDNKGDSSGNQSGGSMENAPPPPPPPGANNSSIPPPPPPPPSKNLISDPPVVVAPTGMAPPPPPPPPPSGNKPIPTLDVPDAADGRSDLLASIRSFKMGNLDKKRNITQRPPPKESAKVVAPAENFMSALMRTMSVRRMAIEGKKDSMSSEPKNTEVETIKRPDEMKIPEKKVEQKVEQSTEDLPPLETIPEKVPEKKATDLLDDWSASDEEDF